MQHAPLARDKYSWGFTQLVILHSNWPLGLRDSNVLHWFFLHTLR
jgi:hypothetical protein